MNLLDHKAGANCITAMAYRLKNNNYILWQSVWP